MESKSKSKPKLKPQLKSESGIGGRYGREGGCGSKGGIEIGS